MWNDCLNAKSHDANEDLLLDIEILSSLLLPSVSLFIVVKLLYIVSFLLGPLLYSDSPRSFDLDLKRYYYTWWCTDEYTDNLLSTNLLYTIYHQYLFFLFHGRIDFLHRSSASEWLFFNFTLGELVRFKSQSSAPVMEFPVSTQWRYKSDLKNLG